MSEVHQAARQGFSTEAASYARGRPDYPEALLAWLTHTVSLGEGKAVVDLGAGTGKFTRMLCRSGAQVTAVEPVDEMLDRLRSELPGARAVPGTAQAMGLPSASADAVTCAQSFHWFANREALAEIHRVLKPGAPLALLWNVRDESVDWVAEITKIITPFEGDAPRFHKGDWRTPFAGADFSPLQVTSFPHRHVGPPGEVILDRFLSVSFIAALPSRQKAAVQAELADLIERHPALRGREEVEFPYRTEAFICRSLPGRG